MKRKIENMKFNLLNIAILRDRITERMGIGLPLNLQITPEGETRLTKRGHLVWMPTIDDDIVFETMHAARHAIARFKAEGLDGINALFNGAAVELKQAMEAEGMKFPEDITGADWIFKGTPWEINNSLMVAAFL